MVGLAFSCLAVSGTWLIVLAALGTHFLVDAGRFPGWGTLAGMLLLCAAVEIVEGVAATWGVHRRGGSRMAGWMAFFGSVGGAILGGIFIPVPLIGSLIGMIAGSFLLVYLAEWNRLRHAGKAFRIARGAGWASVAVLVVKVAATVGLILWLSVGLFL
jgi:uncharacterized protein YqgC (DUF456 family)